MVKDELNKLGLRYKTVELGEVELIDNISTEKLHLVDIALRNAGLELMDDKKSVLIEKIKAAIYQLIYLSDDQPKPNFSNYISKLVDRDYTSLSNLFSDMEGITIEKYIITLKTERVKELLVYSKLKLSEIAFKLQYSSVAHLSNQFKKVTGLTPSFFKQLRSTSRHKLLNV
jgi:methylphosphotriester-DNA--protein-cysteine methyltransferase